MPNMHFMAPQPAVGGDAYGLDADDMMSPATNDIFRYLGLGSCSAAIGSFPMGELADMARAVVVDSHRQDRHAAEEDGMQMDSAADDRRMMDVALPDVAYDDEARRVDRLRLQRLAASAPTQGMMGMLGAEAPTAEEYWDNDSRYDDDDVAWSQRRVGELEQFQEHVPGGHQQGGGMMMSQQQQGSPQRSQQGMLGMARRSSASDFFSI